MRTDPTHLAPRALLPLSAALATATLATATLATAILATVAACAAEPVNRLAIVDRAIEYHGGEIYESSETRLRLCSKGGCFRVSKRSDGGLYEDEAMRERDGLRIRVTNDTVERWNGEESLSVEPDEETRLRDWVSQRVYFPFLPFHLNDDSVYKEDLGIVDWKGRVLHLVKVWFETGTSSSAASEYLYWFDPETARMEQFAYSFEGRPGGLRFRRAHNFRRVGGLLFADNENFGIDADGLSVDSIQDPDYVDNELSLISQIRIEDVVVRALDD